MNRNEALVQAHAHEKSVSQQIEALEIPSPKQYISSLRSYIRWLNDSRVLAAPPPPFSLSESSSGDSVISLGGPILKADTAGQLTFKDSAQLAFHLVLRPSGSGSRMVSASYSLKFPENQTGVSKFRPGFFRIHLEAKTPMDPLQKSRSHFHPGLQHIHIPFPIMEPRAVLNLLIFEVMHNYTQ